MRRNQNIQRKQFEKMRKAQQLSGKVHPEANNQEVIVVPPENAVLQGYGQDVLFDVPEALGPDEGS